MDECEDKKRETRRRVCQMKEAGHALSADICGVESPGVLTKNRIVNKSSLCQQSMVYPTRQKLWSLMTLLCSIPGITTFVDLLAK